MPGATEVEFQLGRMAGSLEGVERELKEQDHVLADQTTKLGDILQRLTSLETSFRSHLENEKKEAKEKATSRGTYVMILAMFGSSLLSGALVFWLKP